MMTGASAEHDRVHGERHCHVACATARQRLQADDGRHRPAHEHRHDPPSRHHRGVRRIGPRTYENRSPRLVVEVLSPSTTNIDRFRKLEEYRRHPRLAYILLIETRFPSAILYRRDGETWAQESFEALNDSIDLPAIGVSLALADVYDDVAFEPGRAAGER